MSHRLFFVLFSRDDKLIPPHFQKSKRRWTIFISSPHKSNCSPTMPLFSSGKFQVRRSWHRPTLPRTLRRTVTFRKRCGVPSALECLTALFGMGRGVPTPLEAPAPANSTYDRAKKQKRVWEETSTIQSRFTKRPDRQPEHEKRLKEYISTSRLNPSQGLHLKPINLVLFEDIPLRINSKELPYLEVGFPLRCFQRLSGPNIATRRCPWQNSRYTRGSFFPVLSY